MLTVEYREIEQILGRSRALTDVSEAHGTLSGALCAATGYTLEDWLREIYADGSTEPDVQQRLQEVFDSTHGALRSQGMEFVALLPDDAAPIAERALACLICLIHRSSVSRRALQCVSNATAVKNNILTKT